MDLVELLNRWELPLVFGAVLLEQGGLPLPAAPLLVAAGALSDIGRMRAEHIFATAIFACLVADHFWFWIGRNHGRRVLGAVCRLSLSPDTCVRQTDDLIGRHGPALLLVAKFIPGVSAVAIPTAAGNGLSYRRFLAFDAVGSLLWAGVYVGAGMIFSREVNRALAYMSAIGGWALVLIGALVAIYVGMKLLQRLRLKRLHRLVRISPAETAELLEEDPDLLIIDARTSLSRADDPRVLPRSVVLGNRTIVEVLPLEARGRTIVTFCTCPNEASAALLAEQLIQAGYRRVRILTGGPDALTTLNALRAA
jgi:membrane protein DedA with SNARE-associated domain/rhodanese-related sulfurtransferase